MSRESYLLYIETNDGDPGAVWSGLGWIDLPADAVLTVPTRFLGGGALVSLPDFQQLINGIAERLSTGLSGVSDEAIHLAISQAAAVKNADVRFGRVTFDQNWQISAVAWIALFRADKIVFSIDDGGNGTSTQSISLSIGTDNTGRSGVPGNFLFTAADQLKRSSDDTFFDGVSGITAGTSRRFRLKDEND